MSRGTALLHQQAPQQQADATKGPVAQSFGPRAEQTPLSTQTILLDILGQQRTVVHVLQHLVGNLDEQAGWQPAVGSSVLNEGQVQTAGARLSATCLGPFELRVDGVLVEGWHSGKMRGLFQYLLIHHDRRVSRDALIEALWPEPDALAAGTSLKVTVHGLRKLLNQAGGRVGESAASILAHDAAYELKVAGGLRLDAEEFEQCCARGRSLEARGRSAEARAQYARAAELYRGDFLAEAWDDWVVFRREHLRDECLFVLARLAEAAVAEGDYQGGILMCQRLLEHDRCREDTYRLLMQCHARLGQPGRVRCWYELCVRALRNDLDAAPEPETERVFREALRGLA